MEYKLIVNKDTKPVEFDTVDNNHLKATINETEYTLDYSLVSDRQIHLTVNGKGVNAFVADGPEGKCIIINGIQYIVQDEDVLNQSSTKKRGGSNLPTEITPITPSVVISVLVKEGDRVKKGQSVVVLSAMKMEITLSSAFNGTVTAVNTQDGDKVAPGDILVDIEADDESTEDEKSEA
ncbi:biotin/lipoyl-binding protein [bacterium]|nr:biotin/lipoyl-binding protein [bacterium]